MSDLMTGDRVDEGSIGATLSTPINGSAGAALPGQGQGPEIQVDQFHGDDGDPSLVTLAMTAYPLDSTGVGAGPLVGIVEFGSGNGTAQRCEFDLPSTGVAPAQGLTAAGGVLVSFPANVVTVKVRNDSGYIPPNGSAVLGLKLTGPIVTASLAVGTKPSGGETSLFRTIWDTNGAPGLAAAATSVIPIPPFAKSVRILRFDAAETIDITFLSPLAAFDGPYSIAANVPAPTLSVPGGAVAVRVKNTGVAAILRLAALFGLQL